MTRSQLNDALVDLLWSDEPLTNAQRGQLVDSLTEHGDERSAQVLRTCGQYWMIARNGDSGNIEVLRTVSGRVVG